MFFRTVFFFASLVWLVSGLYAEKPVDLSRYQPFHVKGSAVIAGSSTVFPLAERMIERFSEEGFGGKITYDSIGSGAGFERFCVQGETDISGASRKIRESEVLSCRKIGREPIAFRIGTDGLAVVVNKNNHWVKDVTMEELRLLFSTAKTWADVRPGLPKKPIQRFIPGTDSGTFDFFVEAVFHKNEHPILSADNTQLSEDDNVLVQGIRGNLYSIGFFGYAYYINNTDSLKVLAINGITPSYETVEKNTYPLARPLFLYSDAKIMKSKPQVAAFIYFVLQEVNNEVEDVGYFPVSQDVLRKDLDLWKKALQ